VTRRFITSVVTAGSLALVLAGEATATPTPSFTVAPDPVVAGQQAVFTSTSEPGVGLITNTEWDFDGDGTFEVIGTPAPHTFPEAGTFDVTLRVTDGDVPENSTATVTQQIDVEEPPPTPPTATFSVLPAQRFALEPVTFTSVITPGTGNIVSTAWDFGDGSSATGATATHPFQAAGTYIVRLSVTDSEGLTDDAEVSVAVNAPRSPVPGFVWSPNPPTVGAAATFTSTSTPIPGFPISLAWQIDGAPAGNAETATHTFTSHGPHSVTLVVDDERETLPGVPLVQSVYVNARPVAGFNAFPDSPLVGETVTLNSTSSDVEGEPVQQWDLDGDGYDDGSGRSVRGMFRVAGNHTVRLLVTDSQGITDTASLVIRVRPSPMLQPIPNQPSSGNPPSNNNPAPAAQQPFLRLITPFPIVRLQGAVVKRGTRIRRLTVRAPKASRVFVFCRGRRCPTKKRLTKVAGRGALRFRALERLVPAGSLVQVFVRRGDQVGKYTSFRIRRKRVPKRIDGCLLPSSPRAVTCPQE
jgi:PKD repeat protein